MQFTASPNNGYTASVGGTCGGTLSGTTYTTAPVTANCTVVATFAQSVAGMYSVAVVPSGTVTGGTVTISGNAGGINCSWDGMSSGGTCTSGTIASGTKVALTATLPTNTLITWGTGCDSSTATTCTIKSLSANMTITAATTATYSITVAGAGLKGGKMVETSGGGTINAKWNGKSTTGKSSETVDAGSSHVITAMPANAGDIVTWSGCDSVTGNGTNSADCALNSVQADTMVTATFAP